MKIYLLKSDHGMTAVSEVIETKDFYFVPVPNTYEYTLYDRKLYTLEILEGVKK